MREPWQTSFKLALKKWIFSPVRLLIRWFTLLNTFLFLAGGCNIIKCPKHAVCHNAPDGTPTCVCPKKDDCAPVVKPVCGTDGKIYINECLMKVIACEKREDTDKRNDGVCGKMRAEYISKIIRKAGLISMSDNTEGVLDFGCLSCCNHDGAHQTTPVNSQGLLL